MFCRIEWNLGLDQFFKRNSSETLTKVDLLRAIHTEHINLETLLYTLTDEQMIRPGVEGQWSVKDIVTHLTFWEQLIADELKAVAAGKTPVAIPAGAIQFLNEQAYQENLNRTMAEVRGDLQRSMREMLHGVATLREDALEDDCTWTDEGSIAQHVANEMGHWHDHMANIRQWLGRPLVGSV